MFNTKILKQSVRNNWKMWLILTGVMSFFLSMMAFVSKSTGGPGGGGRPQVNINQLYSNMFFSSMGIMLVIIYLIVVGNKLVASEVDKGTLSYTLNTPITRKEIIFSKFAFYVFSIFNMITVVALIGIVTASFVAPGELKIGTFLLVCLGLFFFAFATSGICFAASCWFNKSGNSLMVGAGLPVLFYLFSILSGMSGLEFFKYFSLNTLFDADAIVAGTGYIIQFVVLLVIGAALYAVGIYKFLKKDLPL